MCMTSLRPLSCCMVKKPWLTKMPATKELHRALRCKAGVSASALPCSQSIAGSYRIHPRDGVDDLIETALPSEDGASIPCDQIAILLSEDPATGNAPTEASGRAWRSH